MIMKRKQKTKQMRAPIPVGIGAGITERYYLLHLRDYCGFRLKLFPRFFGSDSAFDMEKLVSKALDAGDVAICLYDRDVARWNDAHKHQLETFESDYKKNENVILCASMPSIEYWFLLHFAKVNRVFETSDDVIKELVKYMPYEKREKFLKHKQWVSKLMENNRLKTALNNSSSLSRDGDCSYTDIPKAIVFLEKQNR